MGGVADSLLRRALCGGDQSEASRDAGPAALHALHLSPICAGLKVAAFPSRPIRGRRRRYVPQRVRQGLPLSCARARRLYAKWTWWPDMVTNTVALLELKTRNNGVLGGATLWRYNTQLWLTWTMFSLHVPGAAERSARTW
ncbi:hypothetical protein Q5P01_000538 [Channa striata]|uniref:Uncharacterized protein n=1 Tax=Channa striata TaxID=64152 RepID=A0AA88IID4_CHASR|nr:hypothetical protein Q5P01_000538 [Channa striata]